MNVDSVPDEEVWDHVAGMIRAARKMDREMTGGGVSTLRSSIAKGCSDERSAFQGAPADLAALGL